MAIVQLQLKPEHFSDIFVYWTETIDSLAVKHPVEQPVSIYPLINNDWQLILNSHGDRVLVFSYDNVNPNPTGSFNRTITGELYDIASTTYTAP